MGLHVWDCMCGTDRMGAVCRIADAALIAFLSSTCISAEAIVHPDVMTLFELQILQL